MSIAAFVTVAIIAVAFHGPSSGATGPRGWFATATILAVIPVCSTFPFRPAALLCGHRRDGVAGVVPRMTRRRVGPLKPVAWTFVLLHLILSPPLLALRSRSMDTVEKPLNRALASLPAGPELSMKTVVLVNPPADGLAAYLTLALAAHEAPRPAHIRWLVSGTSAVEITREDSNTLKVRPARGFYEHMSERLMRSPDRPMPPGTTVSLSGVTIKVLETTPDGRPLVARASDLDRAALDDPFLARLDAMGRRRSTSRSIRRPWVGRRRSPRLISSKQPSRPDPVSAFRARTSTKSLRRKRLFRRSRARCSSLQWCPRDTCRTCCRCCTSRWLGIVEPTVQTQVTPADTLWVPHPQTDGDAQNPPLQHPVAQVEPVEQLATQVLDAVSQCGVDGVELQSVLEVQPTHISLLRSQVGVGEEQSLSEAHPLISEPGAQKKSGQ